MHALSPLPRRWLRSPCFLAASLLSLIVMVAIYYTVDQFQIKITQISSLYVEHAPPFDIREALEGKGTTIEQDDEQLVEYVARMAGLIHPPAPSDVAYNLTKPNTDPSMGQSKVVMKVLKNMTGGFFIECGALDGETRSNTLHLEKELGWSGLLVEADPSNFKLVLEKRRKAYAVNVCLATRRHPHTVMFRQEFNVGRIVAEDTVTNQNFLSAMQSKLAKSKAKLARVQCIPIYTLLLALNATTVDYFSLDVEGNEFDVLKTIPFDDVLIRVLSVEFVHDKVPAQEIVEYMSMFGYRVEAKVIDPTGMGRAHDFMFVHKSVL